MLFFLKNSFYSLKIYFFSTENNNSISNFFIFQLSSEEDSSDNRNNIACRLISEEFIGSVVTLFLESKDGTEFKVQIQERELVDINFRGDNELIISWEIHNAHLLPELET